MKKGNMRIKAGVLFLTLFLSCIAFPLQKEQTLQLNVPRLKCNFFDKASFNANTATNLTYTFSGDLLAATVAHHAPAMDMLCALLRSIADTQDIETVYVIAPNHTGTGKPIQVTCAGFFWESGAVDGCCSDILTNDPNLRISSEASVIESDHSASSLVPYIDYYLPDAKVNCILLSRAATENELEFLCKDLCEIAENRKVLFLFSVDFSHYQVPEKASECDEITQTRILSYQLDKIKSMGNEYFDSPEAMYLFMRISQKIGNGISVTDHRIRSFPVGNHLESMTYFVFSSVKLRKE